LSPALRELIDGLLEINLERMLRIVSETLAASATTDPVLALPVARSPPTPRSAKDRQSILAIVNSITHSGKQLRYPSTATAEERALQWLTDVDVDTLPGQEHSLRQRYALMVVWFQMETPNLLDELEREQQSDTWTTHRNECEWAGVQCDGTGRVTRFTWGRLAVKGNIPADLGLLTAMTEIVLFNNGLSGTIPSSLAAMTALRELVLWGNQLSGTIPSSFGALTELEKLELWRNALTGTIPSSLLTLTALTSLQLHHNQLLGTMPFCSNSNSNQAASFTELVVHCNKVSCPCCTHCCPEGDRNGIPIHVTCT
jgi:Leucine rich repeat